MEQVLEVSFPALTIPVEVCGSNSLLGALCQELVKKDLLKNVGVLNPERITFVIQRVHKDINLYAEINKVRDELKIKESKINIVILP